MIAASDNIQGQDDASPASVTAALGGLHPSRPEALKGRAKIVAA